MRDRHSILTASACLPVLIYLSPVYAQAQEAPNQGTTQPDFRRELRITANVLAQKFGTTVLVDPEIAPGSIIRSLPEGSVSECLDGLVQRLNHATWRRVYLPISYLADSAAGQVAAAVRGLEAQKGGSIGVDGRLGGR